MNRLKIFLGHHPMEPIMNRTIIFSLFLVLLFACPCWAKTYYIDPTCSSSGNGTTTTCGANGPFKTWAEIASNKLWAAGNTYLQKGGTTANERITVGASGTSDNVISLGSYGTGNAILDGRSVVPTRSWTGPNANGVYKTTAWGYLTIEDGIFLKECSTTACTDGNWKWGRDGYNYYKPTSGVPGNHTITHPLNMGSTGDSDKDGVGIRLDVNNYINISGFNFQYWASAIRGIESSGGYNTDITVSGNYFENCQVGVAFSINASTSHRIKVQNNTFDYCYQVIQFYGITSGSHDAVEISGNTLTHCSQVKDASYESLAVDLRMTDQEGIAFMGITNSNIYGNSVSGACRGITNFVSAGVDHYNNNYYQNFIHTNLEPIYCSPDYQNPPYAKSFYGNNIHHNILIYGGSSLTAACGALRIANARGNSNTTYNTAYNNTIVENRIVGNNCVSTMGIQGDGYVDYWHVKNNIVYGFEFAQVAFSNAPSHVDIDYNNYYASSPKWIWNDGYVAFPYWDSWKALGFDGHSPNPPSDPAFTNGSGNLNEANDFMIPVTSPAKWAGANVGLLTDHIGDPVHNPPSIGAYEFVGKVGLNPPTGLEVIGQ